MPQGDPRPGERYLHFKNKLYQIIAIAHHSETDEKMVVYQALYGTFKTCVRPYDMFISEVDHVKYPNVQQKYRFELQADAGLSLDGWGDEDDSQDSENEGMDPQMVEFLDADTYGEKFRVLIQMQDTITDRMITNMAVSIDVVIDDGDVQSRYQELLTCVRTRMRYESGRNCGSGFTVRT